MSKGHSLSHGGSVAADVCSSMHTPARPQQTSATPRAQVLDTRSPGDRKLAQPSATEQEPHSPHMSRDGSWGEGLWATLRGALHAHMGWLFSGRTKGLGRYSVDLRMDPALLLANRQFPLWVFFGLFFPAVLAGLVSMSWTGALLGFLWGGLVRVLLVHHVTWSVNSVCHLWGTSPFESRDE